MASRTKHVARAIVLAALAASCGEDGMMHVVPPPAPVGSARVTWTIADAMANPLTCSALGVERTQILLGGKETFVSCGEDEEAIFDNLTSGRYPVIVRLLRLGTAVLVEQAANVIVPEGARGEVTVPLVYDPTLGTAGTMVIKWRINSEPASTGCDRVGGATVEVKDLEGGGSRQPFGMVAPCTAGQVTFNDLPAGGYAVQLSLRNDQGQGFTFATIPEVMIPSGGTAAPPEVPFITSTHVERSELFASWTVNATTAAIGCAAVNADAVLIRAFPENQQVATITATAACEAGELRVEDVAPGPRRHRVVFILYSGFLTDPPIPMQLTSTTARDIVFIRSETSSVSVNLDTP